jgi:plastocyanin
MTDHPEFIRPFLTARRNRRYAAQAITAGVGGLLIVRSAAGPAGLSALAQSDEDDDNSGRGRGRGRGRGGENSGDGNDEDEQDLVQTTAIPAGSLEVRIVSDDAGGFVPGELTVELGQQVSFVNAHSDQHTATGSGFDTGIIPEGGVATVTLDEPGRFPYACLIHPEMTGLIAVRDETGAVPEQAAASASPPADAVNVRIANLAFDPSAISIETGQAVTWTNEDSVPHTVTSLDGVFDSGIFDPGASLSWTFGEAGSFPYQCQLHPTMQGAVDVSGDPGAVASPAAAEPVTRDMPEVWLVELTPADTTEFTPHQALMTFHPDGSISADFVPGAGTTANGIVLTTGHGVWLSGDTDLSLGLIALLIDAEGRFCGSLFIDVEAPRSSDASQFEGTFMYILSSADGSQVGEGTGAISGSLTPVEP